MYLWDKARVNAVGYSSRKQWSQSNAGAFSNSSVFTETPPACFYRQVTVTSCSLYLWDLMQRRGRNLKCNCFLCVSSNSIKCLPMSETQCFLCDILDRITNASLCCASFSFLFFFFSKLPQNTRKSRKQSSLGDLITVLFSPRPKQNRKVNQAVEAWRLIYETKVHEI